MNYGSFSVAGGVLCLLLSTVAHAGVITMSTDRSDFKLTSESFPEVQLSPHSNADIVSVSGNVILDNAEGVGLPPTGAHGYTDFNAVMPGNEYVLNGDENFDVYFATSQNVFAMDYLDEMKDSEFTLEFWNNSNLVGTSAFMSQSPFDQVKFVGFTSTENFNHVRIRESDTGNTNEYFQFYSAQHLPEPGSLAIFGLGTIGALGVSVRRKRKRTAE